MRSGTSGTKEAAVDIAMFVGNNLDRVYKLFHSGISQQGAGAQAHAGAVLLRK